LSVVFVIFNLKSAIIPQVLLFVFVCVLRKQRREVFAESDSKMQMKPGEQFIQQVQLVPRSDKNGTELFSPITILQLKLPGAVLLFALSH